MKTTTFLSTVCAVSAMLAAPGGAAIAAEGEAIDCLQQSRIDRTHVVDERNILFYVRNGDIYLNRLKQPAIGLDRNRPFMYRTTVGRLCAGDLLTVLEDRGFGLVQGAASPLGKFEPIDEAAAEDLRAGRSADVEVEAVE